MKKMTIAVIFGNRDFFPDELVLEARKDIETLFEKFDVKMIALPEEATKNGSVETWEHSKLCADLFRQHRDEIDGVLVTLPNFGDEKGVVDTINLSGLDVPILVQAYPDDPVNLPLERRRDGFCGKISVCNNLRQYGFKYTLTSNHTSHPLSESFLQDFEKFLGVCRVVKGLRNLRVGAVGARPNAFNTVRFSEKLLQKSGISVKTIDLSELFGNASRLDDEAEIVRNKFQAIIDYIPTQGIPKERLMRMAKFGASLDEWMQSQDIQATALQCWNSIQLNLGINPCTLMSMMSNELMPSACEVDITGAVSMYALSLATQKPAALVDWNNNYADEKDKCVFFHCGNWAKSFYPDFEMRNAEILATTLGEENTYGAINGRVQAGPMSFARITTDDMHGVIRSYIGDGEITDDPLETFGSRAVVKVPDLQKLLKHICNNGFEHHAAFTNAYSSEILNEAFSNYMGWEVYHHAG
jgi:L-fucose isomerase-like protein